MTWDSPCLVWDPIQKSNGGPVEYPSKIAEAIDAPIYSHHCHPSLENSTHPKFFQFKRDNITSSLLLSSPLRELYLNTRYAFWKAPKKYDCIITRGPKAIHTVQRLDQDHIHIFDGSYRGFFHLDDRIAAFNQKPEIVQFLLGNFRLNRRTDIQGSIHTADVVVAASEWVADIVKSLYHREVDEVIYPPMSLKSLSPDKADLNIDPYYLYLGNITDLYRVEEAIKAFNQLPFTLKVAGTGPQLEDCKQIAGDNIEFCGYITGEKKQRLLASATALVVPTPHSFGRVIVEALASGTPVIALNEQFAPHIISDSETGMLYDRGIQNLRRTVRQFDKRSWNESSLVDRSKDFSLTGIQNDWRQLVLGDKYE